MAKLDLQQIALLIGKEEPSVFKEYVDHVANKALVTYRQYFQWGGKQGESLYTHVLNGIQVLETLRGYLKLADDEAQVLFTAFTVHDLNKTQEEDLPYGKVAVHETIGAEIERLGLEQFFPTWPTYREDIRSLIRGHSGHHHSGGERLIVKRESVYGLGLERVNALLNLMRAVDVIDLSHTLAERTHKETFLSNLNAYFADSGQSKQVTLFTHRLTEQRGILTNVIHNATVHYLSKAYQLLPLLFYPDGVVYLAAKGSFFQIWEANVTAIAEEIVQTIGKMTTANFEQFVDPRPAGIKIDSKCLELGVPFHRILREVYNIIQKRTPDPAEFDAKVRDYVQRGFAKNQAALPGMAERVQAALAEDAMLVSADVEQLRLAEFIRTYFIFLGDHFADIVPDSWEHLYQLLEIPTDEWDYYAYFDARYA
ncbi:MAG: type I-D CRISPR-associated protein Cas10d/Csc3, partial [Caldilineaceae bacterium]|nr:type I-D CRISPR-associated protein Cas10d/Csc3 [Caldilineaceae bacterium]